LLILLGLIEFTLQKRHRRFLFWWHQCWGCEIVSNEADIQNHFFFFVRLLMFLV